MKPEALIEYLVRQRDEAINVEFSRSLPDHTRRNATERADHLERRIIEAQARYRDLIERGC